ncbi:MAG: hypothetical protein ACFB0E_04785 [Leptolyngbyaceae cyanobacterium]
MSLKPTQRRKSTSNIISGQLASLVKSRWLILLLGRSQPRPGVGVARNKQCDSHPRGQEKSAIAAVVAALRELPWQSRQQHHLR